MYRDAGPKFGPRVERAGKPVRRLPTQPTPCRHCPKIPPGVEPKPENAVELSEKNTRAYLFHLECAAVGSFPADAIVARNARLIADALRHRDALERQRDAITALNSAPRV